MRSAIVAQSWRSYPNKRGFFERRESYGAVRTSLSPDLAEFVLAFGTGETCIYPAALPHVAWRLVDNRRGQSTVMSRMSPRQINLVLPGSINR